MKRRMLMTIFTLYIGWFLYPCESRAQGLKIVIHGTDESAGGVPCYIIQAPFATYFLEKEGLGLSSMLDRDGVDWIGFHKQEGSRAAGEYRGFPNAVHQQDGNFFHPKNKNTEISPSRIDYMGPERITILGTSTNGNWECKWDFYPLHCTFTMTKMPVNYKYWILYEGTPGGRYDDTDWWMTSAVKEKTPLTVTHEGDIPAPEWIAFGDPNFNRMIFLLHHEDDDEIDRFYQMEQQMTVFGFGRKGIEKFLKTVPQSFSIGFLETTNHADIGREMSKLLSK